MRTRLGGSEARARAAAVLLLTLRGTPFLYAGEELGLEDAVRARPSAWSIPAGATAAARRSRGPRRPTTAGPPTRGCRGRPSRARAASRRSAPTRLRCCTWRAPCWRCAATRPPCTAARLELLDDAPDGVLAYERSAGDDRRRVWVNFAGAPAALPEGWVVELATADAGDGLPPDAAAVLRRA